MISPLARLLIYGANELLKHGPPKFPDYKSSSNNPSPNKTSIERIYVTCPNCGHVNFKLKETSPINYICSSCEKYFDVEKEKTRSLKAKEREEKVKEQEIIKRQKIKNESNGIMIFLFGFFFCIVFFMYVCSIKY